MKINRQLNLVQPIETEKGTYYLHSTPIAREVFETYFLVLSKTYAALLSEGLNVIAGPPIARMMLKRIAQNSGSWEGSEGVEQGLLAEIRRLTNVIVPTSAGWSALPYEEVLRQNLIDADALADAEGAIVFFTCTSALLRGPASKTKLTILLDGMAIWGAETTSLDCTAYANSLPTLTPAASSGEKVVVSSVPH